VGAVLGLAAAVAFGVSDFLAGLAARRLHFLWVTLLGQSVGATVVWVSLLWFGGTGPDVSALAWGAASGVGSAVGTLALYRGYGHGEMAVAGPLSAIGAAALPALVGVVLGDRLALPAVAGVLLALPAIWLMAATRGPSQGRVRTGVLDGLLSGVGFGLLFVALDLAGSRAAMWPVAAGQSVAALLVAVFIAVRRPPWVTIKTVGTSWLALGAGALGISATILYFEATHSGLLTVAAVLTSLYPGVTVALAALLLHERPARTQWLGLALGALAVVGIVLG
jgi:drug/metabolite transporter (DMT)-like permease